MEANEASKDKPALRNRSLTKVQRKASQCQKISAFTNDTETIRCSYEQQEILTHTLRQLPELTPSKTKKLLEENIGEIICGLWVRQKFLSCDTKSMTHPKSKMIN